MATAPRLPAALRSLDAGLRNVGTGVADSQGTETPSQDAVDMEMASEEQVQESNQHLMQLDNMKAQLEAMGLPASPALDENIREAKQAKEPSVTKAKRRVDMAHVYSVKCAKLVEARKESVAKLKEQLAAEEKQLTETEREAAHALKLFDAAMEEFKVVKVRAAPEATQPEVPLPAAMPAPGTPSEELRTWGRMLQTAVTGAVVNHEALKKAYDETCTMATQKGSEAPDLVSYVHNASMQAVLASLATVIPAVMQAGLAGMRAGGSAAAPLPGVLTPGTSPPGHAPQLPQEEAAGRAAQLGQALEQASKDSIEGETGGRRRDHSGSRSPRR